MFVERCDCFDLTIQSEREHETPCRKRAEARADARASNLLGLIEFAHGRIVQPIQRDLHDCDGRYHLGLNREV